MDGKKTDRNAKESACHYIAKKVKVEYHEAKVSGENEGCGEDT